ncbi:hypothetical protein [Tenacibaculum finnmarkense]|uniref:Uncharacterized protein n=1 Tax=Tenacibaculum finnmarkense genomovar finnmarkense TaxID=1458503 RepID=A0AAP1RDC3_9FLAO|nr:hypothetical protein [Tenacibaculum finnmarkense]MBE7651814.1 hypothetical protein [Tenacibaculum finnmarkense genomovar finnmarkense]MBE7693836.1 hypothetical protein [Tenacibaculum finnmarkense genomovar finnmarkense]MCD8428133.1 hypothetical protein [Tenacibaculum finnmarkense genomovar finnmarkense]MCG8731883.1 hypothetical protein [Tenacibaculum finnmarkense]MCG8752376.1 hypothetical protein [Tenacibaculum finnmarkense]
MRNYSRGQGQKERRGSKREPKVVFSFEFLDIKQGQTFKQWDDKKDLLKLQELGQTLNKLTVWQSLAEQIIIQYDIQNTRKWDKNNMPKVSKWKYPNTVARTDIPWSKIELGRKLRLIGYLESNIFFVVFLDNNHQFFPSNA